MKSDIINIDNSGNGFQAALDKTRKVAAYQSLSEKETLYLTLCTEEMLSLARSVTGEMQATFWLENEEKQFELHMSTKTVMDKEKRYLLISSATSEKNEAANSFLGRIRDAFEKAIASDVYHNEEVPEEVLYDVFYHPDDPEWDKYERSILRKVADEIKISVRGRKVDIMVRKRFA